jgi:hypothetical protein
MGDNMRWDFQCPACKLIQTKAFTNFEEMETIPVKCYCDSFEGRDMVRLPSAPNFVVRGYNANNGYTS